MSRARITQAGTAKPGTAQALSPVAKALRAFGALLLLTLVAWGAGILQPVVAQTKPAAPAAAASTPAAATARAIFAGGCFWCVESDFDKMVKCLPAPRKGKQ